MFHVLTSSGTTESIFGPTKNVWGSALLNKGNQSLNEPPTHPGDFFIAGGSSGGSAVAVAAGSCVV